MEKVHFSIKYTNIDSIFAIFILFLEQLNRLFCIFAPVFVAH